MFNFHTQFHIPLISQCHDKTWGKQGTRKKVSTAVTKANFVCIISVGSTDSVDTFLNSASAIHLINSTAESLVLYVLPNSIPFLSSRLHNQMKSVMGLSCITNAWHDLIILLNFSVLFLFIVINMFAASDFSTGFLFTMNIDLMCPLLSPCFITASNL